MGDRDDLHREMRLIADLEDFSRAALLGVRAGGSRASATTAVAASAAERVYRLSDGQPELQNVTSELWRANLGLVRQFLGGDSAQHHVLSRAVADFLIGPLNHGEGQDGPDDFDRPQTIAAYSAALSVVTWGVDFALTAIGQVFEAIDLMHGGAGHTRADRWIDVQREAEGVRGVVTAVVESRRTAGAALTPELLASINSRG